MMRSSALHRGIGLSIAVATGVALVGLASLAGTGWAVLAAVPVVTMVLLEASTRRNPVVQTGAGHEADVLQMAARSQRAPRRQTSAELYDLTAYRSRRAADQRADLPEGHLAPVVQLPLHTARDQRLRAHG